MGFLKCDKCGKEIKERGEKLYAKGRWPDARFKKVLCETCAVKGRKKTNYQIKTKEAEE